MNAYLIPLELDHVAIDDQALMVTSNFAGSLVDFSLLPHTKQGENCTPPRIRPNISEDLVSKPFEPTNDPLEKGIHIRWTLPKAFRTAQVADLDQEDSSRNKPKPKYREVPNRWLIERWAFDDDGITPAKWKGEYIVAQQWVIEADALLEQRVKGSRAFPYHEGSAERVGYPEYRFLGQVHDFEEYLNRSQEERDAVKYLDQLTAFGYGEPLYSAYYPESRNVFGFHDDLEFRLRGDRDTEYSFDDLTLGSKQFKFNYTVTGWYEDTRKDPLVQADYKWWARPTADTPQEDLPIEEIWGMGAYETADEGRFPFGLLPEIDHGVSLDTEDLRWFVNIIRETNPFGTGQLPTGASTERQLWTGLMNDLGIVPEPGQTFDFSIPVTGDKAPAADLRGRSVPIGRMVGVSWPAAEDTTVESTRIENARVAIANTPGQALAALLATGTDQPHATEQVLEAIQLGLFGEEDKQDFPSRMKAGLHEGGFVSEVGEGHWVIRREVPTGNLGLPQKQSSHPAAAPPKTIPFEWSEKLKEINTLQRKLDKDSYELSDQQRQYYADWYKYMLAEYDFTLDEITVEAHVNDIREYLARQVYGFSTQATAQLRSMDRLRLAVKNLTNLVKAWNADPDNEQELYRLQPAPGPRYWEPREPVLLLEGARAVPTKMYERATDRLYIELFPNFFGNPGRQIPDILSRFTHNLEGHLHESEAQAGDRGAFLSQDGSQSAWQPLYLDWEVELFPFTKPTDADFNQADWSSNSIVVNYELPEQDTDLRIQAQDSSDGLFKNWLEDNPDVQISGGKRVQTIQGRSILTAGAERPLIEQMKNLLETAGVESGNPTGFDSLIEKLESLPLLSQSLSGFNDALLMRKQVLQLKVKDPLAHTDILRQFTEELGSTIGRANDVAPLPSNLFLPLREGAFRIRELRLVDNWGRTRELQQGTMNGQVIVAESLKPPASAVAALTVGENSVPANLAYVPPRVVQPSRLNFRWTSAERLSTDSGSYAADSPICGYVVPNFLDQSVHVFDSAGKGLGVVGRSGEELLWKPFPGKAVASAELNQHIGRFVDSTIKHGIDFLSSLLATARNSIPATQPENYAQFDGMPLLMGRPLALVRASMSLNLKGLPAINNSWPARQAEYHRTQRDVSPTMAFDKIRFPVRISDEFKAGDGCLAWYIDKPDQDINELYSYYTDEDGSRGESFWQEFDNQRKWLDIYRERLRARSEDLAAITIEISGLSQLRSHLSGLPSLTGRQRLELQGAERLLDEQRDTKQRLDREIADLTSKIAARESNITALEASSFGVEAAPGIYRPHGDLLTLSLEEDPIDIGMLMDPRAAVHLTTGILPVKRIDIPAEQFAHALNNIQMAFLTTPVISPRPKPVPPLAEGEVATPEQLADVQKFQFVSPKQAGFEWAWLQRDDRENWTEIPPTEIEAPPLGFLADFEPQAIYEGWMKLVPEE